MSHANSNNSAASSVGAPSEPQAQRERCALVAGSAPSLIHWAHWLWMAPLAIALSPIGTIIGTMTLHLNFMGSLALVCVQLMGFAILYGFSNGGE